MVWINYGRKTIRSNLSMPRNTNNKPFRVRAA
jgi:hypothetical protein